MTDSGDGGRSPAELVEDIPRMQRAMRRAVQAEMLRHKRDGDPVVVWRDGEVVWLQPHEIPDSFDEVEEGPTPVLESS